MNQRLIHIETNYLFNDPILNGIIEKAVKKFMPLQPERVLFFEVADFIKNQLILKKQCLYTHSLPILKSVCDQIAEDFEEGCDYYSPDASCYRDLYYDIIEP